MMTDSEHSGPSDRDDSQPMVMQKGVRKSSRVNKGIPPARLGFESTTQTLEETLIQTQIERTQMQITLLELKEKQTKMLLEKSQGSSGSQQQFGGQDRASHNHPNAHKEVMDKFDQEPNAIPDDESIATEYTRFVKQVRGVKTVKKTQKIRRDNRQDSDSGSSSGKSTCSQLSVHDVIREQVSTMDKFLSRQTLGNDVYHFDGKFEEWPMFIAWYKNTTKTCHFSDEENLQRLRKCLKGAARECVQILLFSPENVEKIINTLERRFGRPDFLVKSLISKAREIPAVKEEKPETIINMANSVMNLVASLKMFQRWNYIDNPQLLEEFLAKLPLSMRVQWSEYSLSKVHCTLETFSEWMEIRALAAGERVQFPGYRGSDDRGNEKDKKADKKPEKKARLVAAAKETDTEEAPKTEHTELKCTFCGESRHFIADCANFKALSTDDRWGAVSERRLCFICLKAKHMAPNCHKKTKCTVNDCGSRHHNLLHKNRSPENPTVQQKPDESPAKSGVDVQDGNMTGTVAHATASNGRILMKILPVIVSGPAGIVRTSAFLDEGSSITMIRASLADKLGLEGPVKPLSWRGTTPDTKTDNDSRMVDVKIKGSFPRAKEYTMHRVRTVKDLTLPRQSVDVQKLSVDWKYLADVDIESQHEADPEVLIGLDNTPLIVSREVIHGPWKAPYLVRTWLGWVILGTVSAQDNREIEMNCAMVETIDELHNLVRDSFSTESFGTIPHQEPVHSRDDKKALQIMENTTHQTTDGRYEVGLLWKGGICPKVPESREAALKRLRSTERRLDRDPELAASYCEKMMDHIRKGYLVKLSDSDREVPPEKTWYLPHFAVTHPAKKKIRVVFDCAAVSRGVSMNSLLYKGPDLLQSLPAVLANFRRGKFGFTGDIREMFHRVKVREEDQNYQRVLWRGMNRTDPPEEYKLSVMTFGATCSPTLAGHVKDKNAQRFANTYPDTVKEIEKYMYCDDYISCANSIDEASARISEVIEIHKDAGFDVVNWSASDSRILRNLNESEKVKNFSDSSDLDRVLGLWWDSEQDVFTFRLNFHKVSAEVLSGQKIPTKREVLRLVMSIFDPLGFVGMLTVKGKIILQMIWRQEIGWDDEIKDEALEYWQKFLKELKLISSVSIPRSYSDNLCCAVSVQLHVFGDASSSAFAAVAYLRIEDAGGVVISFVSSRTRVAPLKAVTIPRLELQAAVLNSRLSHTLISALDVKIDRIIHWTDSMTVLCWLRNGSRRFKQFVSHRVGEIEQLTDIGSWKWVSTKDNVADLATRMIPGDYTPESRWFRGPEFLRFSEENWPREKETSEPIDMTESVVELVNVNYEHDVDPLVPDARRFSSWTRLLRATARVRKIFKIWYEFTSKARSKGDLTKSELTVTDLKEAEKCLWRDMQRKYLPEISRLQKGQAIDKKSSLYKLSPFVDNMGILRMRSRLENCPEAVEKYPVILDPKHPATKLMILDAHERNMHYGREQIVNNLRERFWIPGIRMAVKASWKDCQRCHNSMVQPAPPEMAPLPLARVEGNLFPFTRTGVDFFGPIMVTKGRRQEKRWGVLFTCMATRAVHLEIAHSLNTDSAIMAIRRFIARRGPVRELFSDNGTNFHGADNEMRDAVQKMDHQKISDTLAPKFIEWNFNPPASPHMGGSWERLVRSVKTAMKATLAFHAPNDEVLLTIFSEVEFIINNRPLTHVSLDPSDRTALTPNHFLIGRTSEQRPGEFDDNDLDLRKAWRKSQRLADCFWRRWIKEYLPELARRSKWFDQVPPLEKNSVVLIADGSLPRNDWPLGTVEEVFPGPDGKIRMATVKTSKGIYKRPVGKICVLNVGATAPRGRMLPTDNI